MTTQEILQMQPIHKKQIVLTGTLSLPLRIGEKAYLTYQNQSVITSQVKRILEVSAQGIVFETCNTIYRLNFTRITKMEVMCA